MNFSKEEHEVINAYEKGKLASVSNLKIEKGRYRNYAKNTLLKNKRINIRLAEKDIIHIQRTAIKEGIPYQILISSILHKYAASH